VSYCVGGVDIVEGLNVTYSVDSVHIVQGLNMS
jgi:hypothetical protein